MKMTDKMLAEAKEVVKTAGDALTAAEVDQDKDAKKTRHIV